jgi:hypothetical protein
VTFFEIVLAVLLSGPVWKGDVHETPEERRQLFTIPARAIATAAEETAQPERAAAILVALFRHESAMGARYVLEGRCMDGPPGMRCDYSDREKRPLAIGPFQVHGWCRQAWQEKAGSYESTLASARCALHYVSRGLKRCLKTPYDAWAGSFATYRGQNCSDAVKVGRNYKGMQYRRSMVEAERQLKGALAQQSRAFLEFLKREYGAPVELAGNP